MLGRPRLGDREGGFPRVDGLVDVRLAFGCLFESVERDGPVAGSGPTRDDKNPASRTLKRSEAPPSRVQSDDPTVVRVLVVHTDDIVTALEANARRDAGAVLRVIPPFSARMRARLHLAGKESPYGDPAPLHVAPERLVDVPPFPEPDATEDELRADPEETYSRKRHRERHGAAVEAWRAAAREGVRNRATVETPAGPHELELRTLG